MTGSALLGLSLYLDDRTWSGPAIAVAGLLAALLSYRRAWARLSNGWLAVDADGAARWRPAPRAQRQRCEWAPFEPLRWHSVGPIAWIDGVSGARRLRLLSGRDLASDAQWRQLQAWLRWMDRGGASRAHLESAVIGPISS